MAGSSVIIVLLVFFDLFVKLFNILIIGRILLGWTGLSPNANGFARVLYDTTEPVLMPIRRIVPQAGMFDPAPLVAVVLLYGLHFLIFGS